MVAKSAAAAVIISGVAITYDMTYLLDVRQRSCRLAIGDDW